MDLISRQAAIDAVIEITYDQTAVHHGWVDPYYVINRLEYLPTAEPSTTIMKVEVGADKERLKKALEEAELTLLPAEKKGMWRTEYDTHTKILACSACGGRVIYSAYTSAVGTRGYAYCPYCGARMEEE